MTEQVLTSKGKRNKTTFACLGCYTKGTSVKALTLFIFATFFSISVNADVESVLSKIDKDKELTNYDNACPANLYKGPENQYKDYISFCSGAMSRCLKECQKGSSNHCYGLASNLQDDSIDIKYSERLFSKACSQGLVTACTNRAAGMMRFSPEKKECYSKSFRLTCDKSDAWGCTMYGLVLSRGIGVAQNTELALKVLKTGCKNGAEDEACQYAKAVEKSIKEKQ